jgi:hypothetical protein
MPVLGHQRRFRDVRVMSDLAQTADVPLVAHHGSDGPQGEVTSLLFDHTGAEIARRGWDHAFAAIGNRVTPLQRVG